MPLGAGSAKDRLKACNKSTTQLKSTSLVGMQYWIQSNILPLLPSFLAQKTAHDVFSRHSMVFSNLPGPEEQVSLGSKKLLGLHAIFPNILPQVLLLSYHGGIFLNMSLDGNLVKDVDLLRDCYLQELREMAGDFDIDCSDEEMLNPQQQYLVST